MRNHCIAITTSGKPCGAKAAIGSDFCYSHNPEVQERIRKEVESRYIETRIRHEINYRLSCEAFVLKHDDIANKCNKLSMYLNHLELEIKEAEKKMESFGAMTMLEAVWNAASKSGDGQLMMQTFLKMDAIRRRK